jgi:hypothetical protein
MPVFGRNDPAKGNMSNDYPDNDTSENTDETSRQEKATKAGASWV